MQVHGSTHESIAKCARSVYENEGFRAFYISYPTTLAMTIPFTAIQFAAYESLSKVLNPSRRYDPFTHCISGGMAGAVAAAMTTPLDVIKTLLQTRGTARDIHIRNSALSDLFLLCRYLLFSSLYLFLSPFPDVLLTARNLGKGLVDAAKIIHEREGWKGFLKGLRPRIVTTMPSTAICW